MYFDELDLNDNVLDALYDMRFDIFGINSSIPAFISSRDFPSAAITAASTTSRPIPVDRFLESVITNRGRYQITFGK